MLNIGCNLQPEIKRRRWLYLAGKIKDQEIQSV